MLSVSRKTGSAFKWESKLCFSMLLPLVFVTVLPEIVKKECNGEIFSIFSSKYNKIKTGKSISNSSHYSVPFATSLQCQFTLVHMETVLPWTYLNLLRASSNKIPVFSCGKIKQMSVKCKVLNVCLDWQSSDLDFWVQEVKSYIPGVYRLGHNLLGAV